MKASGYSEKSFRRFPLWHLIQTVVVIGLILELNPTLGVSRTLGIGVVLQACKLTNEMTEAMNKIPNIEFI